MKKIISTTMVAAAFLMSAAIAAPNPHPEGCGFTDNMYIQAPVGTTIQGLTNTGGLAAQQINSSYFQIKDNGSCNDGTVTVKVGTNAYNFSVIQLSDGPMMWNPNIVNVQNHGNIHYDNINHSLGTFVYTLEFSH